MAYIDVDKAVFLCLHVRRADAVFMQGKALIDDNQAKALSKAVHGYLISALRYIAFAFYCITRHIHSQVCIHQCSVCVYLRKCLPSLN